MDPKTKKRHLYVVGGIGKFGFNAEDIYQYSVETGEWKVLVVSGSKPPGRSCQATVLVDRTLYMFGGRKGWTSSGIDNILYCIDITADSPKWKAIKPEDPQPKQKPKPWPSSRFYHTMCTTSDLHKLFVFGGFNHHDLGDFWRYDIKENKWTLLAKGYSLPEDHYHLLSTHANISQQQQQQAAGLLGQPPTPPTSPQKKEEPSEKHLQELFDMERYRFLNPMPCARFGHVMQCVNDKIYIIGGCCNKSFALQDVWEYLPSEYIWNRVFIRNYPYLSLDHSTLTDIWYYSSEDEDDWEIPRIAKEEETHIVEKAKLIKTSNAPILRASLSVKSAIDAAKLDKDLAKVQNSAVLQEEKEAEDIFHLIPSRQSASCVLGKYICMFGGELLHSERKVLDEFLLFDTDEHYLRVFNWKVSALPLTGHTLQVCGKDMYIIGGKTSGWNAYQSVFVVDIGSKEPIEDHEIDLLGQVLAHVNDRYDAFRQLNEISAKRLIKTSLLDDPAIRDGLIRVFKNGAPRELQQAFQLLLFSLKAEFKPMHEDVAHEFLNFIINHLTLVKTFVTLAMFQPTDEILIDQEQIIVIKLYMRICIALCQHFDTYEKDGLVAQLVSIFCTIFELSTDSQLQKQPTSTKSVEKPKSSISLLFGSKKDVKKDAPKKNGIPHLLALVEFMQQRAALAFHTVCDSTLFAKHCDLDYLHKTILKFISKFKVNNQATVPPRTRISRFQIDNNVKSLPTNVLLSKSLQIVTETSQTKKTFAPPTQSTSAPVAPDSPRKAERKRISERLWENILDKQIPLEEVLRSDSLRKYFDKYVHDEYAATQQDKQKVMNDLLRDISFWLKVETKLRNMIAEHKNKPLSEAFIEASQAIINEYLLPTSSSPLSADVLEKHQQAVQQMATILQQPLNHVTNELFTLFDQIQQTVAQTKILDVYNQFRESSSSFRDMKQELEQRQNAEMNDK